MNLAEMNAATKKKLLLLAMTFSMFAFSSQLWQKTQYINSYRQNTDTRKSITAVLEQIPEDASITASTFFVPQLGNREEIYMIDDNEIKDGITYNTDYVVFDLRPNYTSDAISDAITVYEQKGYKEVSMVENTILLLKRK